MTPNYSHAACNYTSLDISIALRITPNILSSFLRPPSKRFQFGLNPKSFQPLCACLTFPDRLVISFFLLPSFRLLSPALPAQHISASFACYEREMKGKNIEPMRILLRRKFSAGKCSGHKKFSPCDHRIFKSFASVQPSFFHFSSCSR